MKIASGETWLVEHRRKGKFTSRVLDPVDTAVLGDQWIRLEIVAGTAHFMASADAVIGDVITVRADLCRFVERRDPI